MRFLLAVMMVTVAFAGCSDEGADDDRDGLPNGQETHGWSIYIDLMGRRIERHVTSDPNLQDTDGDGVLDVHEYFLSLDPRDRDTDDDGLTDCQEVFHTNKTECEDPNWEGFTDEGYGTIGNNADSDPRPSRYNNDHTRYIDETGTLPEKVGWGDGISDGDEILGYNITLPDGSTRFVTSDPLLLDSDGDFLEDGEERWLFGTDPANINTDGDDCIDGHDAFPLFDERYDLGMQTVTWSPADGSGSKQIQMLLHVADTSFNAPAESGLNVQHGQAADLSSYNQGVKQGICQYNPGATSAGTVTPVFPWVRISIRVREVVNGSPGALLDFTSDDVPNTDGIIWWNVRDGSFNWNAGSPATIDTANDVTVDGSIEWSGKDGSVAFSPVVVKPRNQNP